MLPKDLKNRVRVCKVTVSRSVPSPRGNSFLSMTVESEDHSESDRGFTVEEAEKVALFLGLKVDLSVYRNAAASSLIPKGTYQELVATTESGYQDALQELEND
jgi:hypothetical protein